MTDAEIKAQLDAYGYTVRRYVDDDGRVSWMLSSYTRHRQAFITHRGTLHISDNSVDGFDGLEEFAAYAQRVLTEARDAHVRKHGDDFEGGVGGKRPASDASNDMEDNARFFPVVKDGASDGIGTDSDSTPAANSPNLISSGAVHAESATLNSALTSGFSTKHPLTVVRT